MKLFTSLFKTKKDFYDLFLEGDSKSVVGKTPALASKLAEDVFLELYAADGGAGEGTWAIAVILVTVGDKTWRTKYDSGRVHNDLGDMQKECFDTIKKNWDLDYWRRIARKEVNKKSWFRR